ncbi:MAG: NAD(P)-dependent alcohol dehydrogenase, partial [Rhabdochlamydiaceae bacterium]
MFHAYAAPTAKGQLVPYDYSPPALTPSDVEIKIECCGLCYSDVHLIDDDWKISQYPLVPGHEIVGTVVKTGSHVKDLKVGDRVGVGWQCSACLSCDSCLSHNEASCASKIRTCVNRPGGFADKIIVNYQFAYPIPSKLSSPAAAPLLCAGSTVYTPFRLYEVQAPQSVAVIGIGGLGHLALQFAHAFGCEVTAISTSPEKKQEAHKFGAHHFLSLKDLKPSMPAQFDFILSTIHADLEWSLLLTLLKPGGKLCFVGVPPTDLKIPTRLLISGNRSICGSGTGSRYYMREMLQFAARHDIQAQVETFPMSEINNALLRLKNNQARYRLVLCQT